MSGSEKRQRNKIYQVRLDETEAAYIKNNADRCNIAIGTYMRSVLMNDKIRRRVKRPPIDHQLMAEALRLILKAGNNINQLTYLAHIDKIPEVDELSDALEAFYRLESLFVEALGINKKRKKQQKTPSQEQ